MMARSHVVLGLAAWVSAVPLLQLPAFGPAALGLAMIGSLLPDLDHPKSWVGRRTRPVSTIIAGTLGHRGITHSAIAVVGLAWLLGHVGTRQGLAAPLIVGTLSHLAADMLTPQGLRLAWPARGTWGLPLCRTGSPAETAIVALACAVVGWRLLHGGGDR